MCFVQTPEMLRLIAGEQPGGNSMNRACIGKRKFVDRHYLNKILAPPAHYGELGITGTDNVKTSPHRQVKAHAFHILLRSSLLFLSFLLQNVNAAEDVNLIFVNGNISTANERKQRAEAIAVRYQRIVFVGSNED